jgi:hypothetical protein
LAKFYGRAGLINLINASPSHLHPEVFRSLIYEACGRIVNPVYGSVGLMSSGNWSRCQAAVDAVLQGVPLMMPVDAATAAQGQCPVMPFGRCDIRHLSKDSPASSLHHIRSRNGFKRSATHGNKSQVKSMVSELMSDQSETKFTITGWNCGEDYKNFGEKQMKRAPSHDSFSVETVEPALLNRDEQGVCGVGVNRERGEISLDLTLGMNTVRPTVTDISDSET